MASTVNVYRALVVEDEFIAREATVTALTDEGFDCEWSGDAEDAASKLEHRQFDVVITDLKLPRRNGHSLAVELSGRSSPRPLVVVLTGILEPRLVKDLIARGVDDVAFKPADPGVLGAKIRALCDRQQRKNATANARQDNKPIRSIDPIRPEQIQAALDRLAENLPVFDISSSIAQALQERIFASSEVVSQVIRDPLLLIQVIVVANGCLTKQISGDEFEQVVTWMGQRQIRGLAHESTRIESLLRAGLPWANVNIQWRRCLASGLAIQQLAPEAKVGGVEESSYISALLLPLSRTLLGLALPDLYAEMFELCQGDKISLATIERRILPMTPAQAVAGMFGRWKVPARIYKPLQYCGSAFSELSVLDGPVRLKVEQLKVAEFLGQLAVGHFEPWHEVDLPSFETICHLKLDDVVTTVERIRSELAAIAPGANVASPSPATPVRYFKLSADHRDPFAALMQSSGISIEAISRADACRAESAVVNCIDVSRERMQWFLDDAIPESNRCLVYNTPLPDHNNLWGPVVQLPCRFQTLISAMESGMA